MSKKTNPKFKLYWVSKNYLLCKMHKDLFTRLLATYETSNPGEYSHLIPYVFLFLQNILANAKLANGARFYFTHSRGKRGGIPGLNSPAMGKDRGSRKRLRKPRFCPNSGISLP